jgi:hypothetical protein
MQVFMAEMNARSATQIARVGKMSHHCLNYHCRSGINRRCRSGCHNFKNIADFPPSDFMVRRSPPDLRGLVGCDLGERIDLCRT